MDSKKLKNDSAGDRTQNLWFRRPAPYPLGHRVLMLFTEEFLYNLSVDFPNTSSSWFDRRLSLEECEKLLPEPNQPGFYAGTAHHPIQVESSSISYGDCSQNEASATLFEAR
ncbi:unnamed protein product [Vicia faba]|uniref:Uncharacterized protein n=1 Tax=Vicia faba TaxID=3906 RepID=A0AAV1A6J4_VICFA|nr:unnamed protein product [Vicia faba]